MPRHASRQDVIDHVISPALDEPRDYDLDGIFDQTFAYRVDTDADGNELLNTAGFEQIVPDDEFWASVERNARTHH